MKKVKDSWNDITLNEFLAVGKVAIDEDLKGRPLATRIALLATVSDYTVDELMELNRGELELLLRSVAFLDEEAEDRSGKNFTIDGVEYREHVASEMSTGEVISIEMLMANPKGNTLAEQFAIIFRPIDEGKFNVDLLADRAKLFGEALTVPNFIKQLIGLEPA